MKEHIVTEFQKLFPTKKYFVISSATGQGIEELKDFLVENYTPLMDIQDLPTLSQKESALEHTLFDLKKETEDERSVKVRYLGNYEFEAS